MDEIMINNMQESVPDNSAECNAEKIYIGDEPKASGKSDDVMMTQGILCIILVLALVVLRFINGDFLDELLSIYAERTSSPPEDFLADIIISAEQWFRK